MGFPTDRSLSLLSLSLTFLTIFDSVPTAQTASEITTLVYKGCASQKFQDSSGIYSQNLNNLFKSLLSQSSNASFYSTTAGESQSAVFGLYQCRGDLRTADCYNCVSRLPDIAARLCGDAIAARIQLNGCYARYEIAGFKQISGTELLYKVCGASEAGGSADQFGGNRDTAFEMVEKGVVQSENKGFYTGSYGSVYVLGQCEGDLGSGECGDCVKTALERVKVECGSSMSGQVYLHKCYISYSYYPNGVSNMSSETGQGTEKTVAIVVGVAAAVGFVVVCLMFARSLLKKK